MVHRLRAYLEVFMKKILFIALVFTISFTICAQDFGPPSYHAPFSAYDSKDRYELTPPNGVTCVLELKYSTVLRNGVISVDVVTALNPVNKNNCALYGISKESAKIFDAQGRYLVAFKWSFNDSIYASVIEIQEGTVTDDLGRDIPDRGRSRVCQLNEADSSKFGINNKYLARTSSEITKN